MPFFSFRFSIPFLSVIILSSCSFSSLSWENKVPLWVTEIIPFSASASNLPVDPRIVFSGSERINTIGTGGIALPVKAFDIEIENCIKQFGIGSARSICLNGISIKKAVALRNSKECENITDQRMKSICNDNILFREIIAKKDISLCSTLKGKWLIGNCIATLGKWDSWWTPCEGITDKEIQMGCNYMYFTNQAIAQSDTTICEKIVDIGSVSICKNVVGSMLKRVPPKASLWEKIPVKK